MQAKHNYKISDSHIGDFKVWHILNQKRDTWFSIIPEYGGCLNSFVVNGRSILWSASTKNEIESQTINYFAGAQLFPYPNRVKNARYSFNEKEFLLPQNDYPRNNALHGLVYNQPFTVDGTDIEKGEISISYDYQKQHPGYPFEVLLKNKFQLDENSLNIFTTITNMSSEDIPIGHGWHPYFNIPHRTDGDSLQISGNEHFPIDEHLIPYGNTEVLKSFSKHSAIGIKELNHCFKLKENKVQKTELVSSKDGVKVTMITEGYPYLQVYTPSHRNCIALEPQTCIPDAFNNQIGCRHLKSNETLELGLRIKVEFN
ncbi:MAG: aldose 1-epimerase [Maribacter sp.]|nr:aldose 1-epimerase [Maribacter sp.]